MPRGRRAVPPPDDRVRRIILRRGDERTEEVPMRAGEFYPAVGEERTVLIDGAEHRVRIVAAEIGPEVTIYRFVPTGE